MDLIFNVPTLVKLWLWSLPDQSYCFTKYFIAISSTYTHLSHSFNCFLSVPHREHLQHTSHTQGYHFKIFLNIFSTCSSSCTWKFQVVAYNFSCTCALGRSCDISLPNVTNPMFLFVVCFCLFHLSYFSCCASHLMCILIQVTLNVEKNVHKRHH